ncbi:MAG: TetR/AcrR family transcriptional regulator [Muribaculaceae bacterium]|nr:TetR/AcrR family transcriptional regulator [Muribaculaceae bacterium]
MVSKTREKFIEVARQLFARKGVENTTMNDIASASDKGRRTIYTYFKSKREIFNAVIESESDQILRRLSVILAKPISPEEKLCEFVACRFEAMKEIVSRNGSLRAGFFRDVRKVDRARKLIARKEVAMLEEILREGVEKGVFRVPHLHQWAIIIDNAIHGLDVPFIRNNLAEEGIDKEMLKDYMATLILNSVRVNNQ